MGQTKQAAACASMFAFVLMTAACTGECAPGVGPTKPYAVQGTQCPTVGRMGNAKLAIPPAYISDITAYKGVDIWKAESYKTTPKHPTFDNDIDLFGICLRETNFKPVETWRDWEDARKSAEYVKSLPPHENRWIDVDFDARGYPFETPSNKAADWYKDAARWGPYVREPDVWGLAHYVSVQLPSSEVLGHDGQEEYFYDETQNTVFMFCRNILRKVPPYDLLSRCQIEFTVPRLKAYARVFGIRDRSDLSNWRQIREGVLRVSDSFIVP